MSLSLDLDSASAALISQLTLDDIEDIRGSTKGKAREDSPPSDTYIDTALELDQPVLSVLSVVEDGLRDDHRYAEALQNGQALPAQSEVQRLLEDPNFTLVRSVLRARRWFGSNEDEVATGVADTETATNIADPSERGPVRRRSNCTSRAHCIICRDDLRASTSFRAPCEHFYCRQCLSNLAISCIGDESLFPLQCCRQPLPMDGTHGVFARLEVRLRFSLRAKAAEFGTLAKDRLYCSSPTCSAFLGSTVDHTGDVRCRCGTVATHPARDCEDNAALEQVKALAQEKHWQTCPGCGQIIDLQQGCFHMTCRCRTEFCYLCAARWKSCPCPQWEEARLLNTAEQRVENEMGARARAAAPEIFQHRVQERVERLRYDHDCANGHRWRRRDGRARCEECRYMLPEYLLLCRSCGIAVCVRCARNRL
ncbi:hypothetical protein FB451DRAFT_1344032 [Mycena latifolia]|nr:hypothetical protein FB451DRAFT_1344032 [Mycena latifolia]